MLKEILTRHLDHRVDPEYAIFLEEQLEYDIKAIKEHKNLPFINRDMRNLLDQRKIDDELRPGEIKGLERILEETEENEKAIVMTVEEEDEILIEAFIHRVHAARKGKCPHLALHSNEGDVIIAIVDTGAQFSLISQ
jgi:hypothetical protein